MKSNISIIRVCRTWPSKTHNGVGLHSYYYSKYINIKTIVFFKEDKNYRDIYELPNIKLKKIKYEDLKAKSGKRIRLFSLIALSKIYGEFCMLLCLLKSTKEKSKNDFLILHVHSSIYLISSIIFSFFRKSIVILQLGGTEINRFQHSPIHQFLLKKVDGCVCVTNQFSEEIKKFNPDIKTKVIDNGVDLNIFKISNEKNPNYFVSIGSLTWKKNYKMLINAFSKFRKINSSAILDIFGEGPLHNELQDQIINLNLSGVVNLKGLTKQDDLCKSLSKAYIYFQSSIQEGLAKAILEAICCGTPVVSTNAGSCGILAKKYGIGLDSFEEEEFLQAIIKLYEDKNLWLKSHQNCLNNRNQFSWKYVSMKVLDLYQELIKEKESL